VFAAGVLCSLAMLGLAGAQQVGEVPRAEVLRYQLVGIEPIAAPDNRSLVNGWSVLLFKDRRGGVCYVAFARGDAISATNAAPCPP
jgi:hypothetical protein